MKKVQDYFLQYVKFDTTSAEDSATYPSTPEQLVLGKALALELTELGLSHVKQDPFGYVTAILPASADCKKAPKIGFIAHMDTSPAVSGKNIKPSIVKNYQGGDIVLNEKENVVLSETDYPNLTKHIGHDLIVTDGTTLLGADDKAGIAEIMSMLEFFIANPDVKHGTVKIAFTPDEEVGAGTDHFDVKAFDADFAYTIDGGILGELSYENFNAASITVTLLGKSIHTGDAKAKMVNASLLAMEFNAMLPTFEIPSNTEKYEGFFHLDDMQGSVELATLKYIIRDHDATLFNKKKILAQQIATFMNQKYGKELVTVTIKDSYQNMRTCLADHMHIVETAKNAMLQNDVNPLVTPIRGGTDGARLSYKGLPCPNICTGGQNFHGRFEYVSIYSMEKITQIIIDIVRKYAK